MSSDACASGPGSLAHPEPHDGGQRGAPERLAFSVVLPAFDEEQGLLAILEDLRSVLRRGGRTYEIIVVDDGSTDGTTAILAACSDVTVVRHAENRGYGAALKAGIRVAQHPLVAVMDADGTYAAAAVPVLVERCATADMVVGARLGVHMQSSPARNVTKWCFRQFAQWITRAKIPDLNSGLRVFRRSVAERFMALLPDGFSFTTTITVASMLERLVVGFETVDYMPRIGRSKIRPVRDTLRIARQLLRLGVRFAPWRTAIAIALPVFLLGAVLSARHLLHGERLPLADLGWMAAGLILLVAGMRAEQRLQRRRCLAASDFVPSRGFTA